MIAAANATTYPTADLLSMVPRLPGSPPVTAKTVSTRKVVLTGTPNRVRMSRASGGMAWIHDTPPSGTGNFCSRPWAGSPPLTYQL